MGVVVRNDFNCSKLLWHLSSHTNLASLTNSSQRGLASFEKSLINLLQNPTCKRNCLTPLTLVGDGNLTMSSTFALSTSIPSLEMICLRTIPCCTMKWHFSQLSTKSFSIHRFRTTSMFTKQSSNALP